MGRNLIILAWATFSPFRRVNLRMITMTSYCGLLRENCSYFHLKDSFKFKSFWDYSDAILCSGSIDYGRASLFHWCVRLLPSHSLPPSPSPILFLPSLHLSLFSFFFFLLSFHQLTSKYWVHPKTWIYKTVLQFYQNWLSTIIRYPFQ